MALAVAPKERGGQSLPEDVTCHPHCPSTLCCVSVDRNGQTVSSASEGLLSSLPPHSLKHNGNWSE